MLRETTVGDVVVFSAPSDVSPATAREIEGRVVMLMRSHARRFVFDLSGCVELSPAVIQALVRLKLELDRLGGALVLAGARDEVLSSLEQDVNKMRLPMLPSLNLALRFLEDGEVPFEPPRALSSPRPAAGTVTGETNEAHPVMLSRKEATERIQDLLSLLPPPPFLARLESGEDW